MSPGRTGWGQRIGRAMPRLLGVTVGLVLMLGYEGWVSWAGLFMFVSSVVGLLMRPVSWWKYVMTGPDLTPYEEYAEPGHCQVRLDHAGPRPIALVKAVREVSNLGLLDAKAKVDDPPSVIAAQVSERSAARIRACVERAGGTVSVVSEAPSP